MSRPKIILPDIIKIRIIELTSTENFGRHEIKKRIKKEYNYHITSYKILQFLHENNITRATQCYGKQHGKFKLLSIKTETTIYDMVIQHGIINPDLIRSKLKLLYNIQISSGRIKRLILWKNLARIEKGLEPLENLKLIKQPKI